MLATKCLRNAGPRFGGPSVAIARRLSKVRIATPEIYSAETEDPELVAFQKSQKSAQRLTNVEEARTLMKIVKNGVLCTLSATSSTQGFPFGSVLEFVVDDQGLPCFSTSSLSPHTGDMLADPRVSLTVTAPDFKGVQDARFTLVGRVITVSDADAKPLREAYLRRFPDAFWVDFGDFRWWRMESVEAGRYIGGFGGGRTFPGSEYTAAMSDPIAAFSAPVCGHMNADHSESTVQMVKQYCGLTVDSAKMLDLDRLGVNVEVTRKGQTLKIRLPFPRPATDRKTIKELIVEMTKASKPAAPVAPVAEE